MDGTLIRNTDSVSFLCNLNHADKTKLNGILAKEDNNELHWIDADYEKVKLLEGLDVQIISGALNELTVIHGLFELISEIHKMGWIAILVTAGPDVVARLIAEKYNFDHCYSSKYSIKNGKLTSEISYHVGEYGKVECLETFCQLYDVSKSNCIAIGDGATDIQLFKNVGTSVAINYSESIKNYATFHINTRNILDISKFIFK